MNDSANYAARTELVEVPFFFSTEQEEVQVFDELSPNGFGTCAHD